MVMLPARPDLEYYRKQAKALRRAESLALSDAQRLVAREHGFASWPALKRAVTEARLPLAEAVNRAQPGWGERAEAEFDAGEEYAPGRPVRVHVEKRLHRYVLDDRAAAFEHADRPPGWLAVAERVAAEHNINVNRQGVVMVPAVEGRDLGRLAVLVAETSVAVYDALLELWDTDTGGAR
jgi:hypothetical protein